MTAIGTLNEARSQLGYHEGPDNDTKYGVWYGDNHEPWCDQFVSWCGAQAGESKAVGKFEYTPSHLEWFRSQGRFGHSPRFAALVFYKWPGVSNDECDHVGIVEAVNSDGTITTIEGNVGDVCVRKVRSLDNVVGFGYPNYFGGNTPPPPPNPGTKIPYPGHYIQFGDNDSSVYKVQKQLLAKGYSLPQWGADGQFGNETLAAVKAFQANHNLQVDGVVGPITWGALF